MTFLEHYKAVLKAGVPLLCVRTFDAKSTIDSIKAVETKTVFSLVVWDAVNGLRAVNKQGGDAITAALSRAGIDQPVTAILLETLRCADHFPDDTVMFLSNAHLFWQSDPAIIQGIWNLRDTFKAHGKLLIMLTVVGSILPSELAPDTFVLDEPLPTEIDLHKIVNETFDNAKLPAPAKDVLTDATKALIGLPYFPSEQSIAMCLDKKAGSLDIPQLWERKRQAINQTRGLKVLTGKESLADIGGLEQVKTYLCRVCEGMNPPNLILFMDEVEKGFAGTGTDTSGVSTKQTGTMLEWTEDKQIRGVLCLGIPGVGKSQLAKSIGNKYGIPIIKFDIAAMESGIVGSSNEYLRTATAMIDSISGGKVLMIATCNSVHSLPAELKRRFSAATFFFDAPETQNERNQIWDIYRAKYSLPVQTMPHDVGWTGAEIKNCAYTAYDLQIPLTEASQYIIPVTVSDKARIDALRRDSSGKYLSASKAGVYQYDESTVPASIPFSETVNTRRIREE